MPRRAHDKHGAFIMLVCVFIAADSIVQGKEAHVELCIESQYDGKEHWGKIQKTWALILSVFSIQTTHSGPQCIGPQF